MRGFVSDVGRDPASIDIQVEGSESRALLDSESLDGHRERVAELEAVGVRWFVVDVPASSVSAALEEMARYGEEIISGT